MISRTGLSDEAKGIAKDVRKAEYSGPMIVVGNRPDIAQELVKRRTPFVLVVEKNIDKAEKAKRYVEEAGLSDRVHVSQGDIRDPAILDGEVPAFSAFFEDVEDAPPQKDVYAGILFPASLWKKGVITEAIRNHLPPVATKDAIIYGTEIDVSKEVEETLRGEYQVERAGGLLCIYRNEFV